jgi:hypothetical protein
MALHQKQHELGLRPDQTASAGRFPGRDCLVEKDLGPAELADVRERLPEVGQELDPRRMPLRQKINRPA